MPIFESNNGKLKVLNPIPMRKERDLQRLIENNMYEALNMHLIASEYRTEDGRIDSLAVDIDGCPVIIEYKRDQNDNVINQSFTYLNWLKTQRQEFFEMLMLNRLGAELANRIKLDWAHPRIICVAENFSKYDIATVKIVPLRIDLYRYRYYEQGVFSLELVAINERQKCLTEASMEMPAETNFTITQSMKNQSNTLPVICDLYDELRERIMSLDSYIIEKVGKRVISFRLSNIFAEILIRKDKLVIDLRPLDYNDPRKLIQRIAESYTVTLNRRLTVSDPADLDYAFAIIQQSYNTVL